MAIHIIQSNWTTVRLYEQKYLRKFINNYNFFYISCNYIDKYIELFFFISHCNNLGFNKILDQKPPKIALNLNVVYLQIK